MAVVVVTGSSSGIGMATALGLARAGHDVVATMRNPSASEIGQIVARDKLPVRLMSLDVDNDESVRSTIHRILKERGRIDALVNNAGIGGGGSVEELPLDEFRRVMETNFFGALRCIQAVLPSMREQRSGCIVNITSVAGRIALSPQAPYAASKFALEALSEALAQEMKPFGVRVAIVEPGVIKTPIFGKMRDLPTSTPYPHERRLRAIFAASLNNPVSPDVVADEIRGIIEGASWQLRYPVGPDAAPFIGWRSTMTDEAWIAWNATDDATWCRQVKEVFGLDVSEVLQA